jgi:hypothetical protein
MSWNLGTLTSWNPVSHSTPVTGLIYLYLYLYLYYYSSNYDNKYDIWTSKSSVAVVCFLPGRAKDLSASLYFQFKDAENRLRRPQWPRGLRRSSAAACLLRLCVQNPPWARISVSCQCFVLSGRGPYNELITRPEESYRLWCVVVCDLEISWMRRPWSKGGYCAKRKKWKNRLT